jgi:hypothetical protein
MKVGLSNAKEQLKRRMKLLSAKEHWKRRLELKRKVEKSIESMENMLLLQ